MSRHRDSGCPLDCKVYVGDLGNSGTKHEIEEAFSYYGPLRSVWVARNPPGFAFVEFEDTRDARDATRALDGKVLCGRRCRVELTTGKSRSGNRGAPGPPRPFHSEDRCYDCGERGHYARDCKRVSRRYRDRSSRRSRSRSRSHNRSVSRSRSQSRSRSPRRSRSASGSRGSRSPKNRRAAASPQRSPSRSPRGSPSRSGNAD